MPLNTNFAEKATLDGQDLKVSGRTEDAPDEWQLLTRYVVVSQGEAKLRRAATKGAAWNAKGRGAPASFRLGTAVATGIETYYCENDGSGPPSVITITWSQQFEIEP